MEENKDIKMTQELRQAVADIKAAILQGQYEACKGVNRIQLAVYFGIGKYVSQHSRKGTWGTWRLGSYQQPAAQGTARTERLFGHQPEENAIVL